MMLHRLILGLGLLLLVSCGSANQEPLPQTVTPIGDFRMGFNVVVANDMVKGPGSRNATEEELTTAIRATMEERVGRYDGDGLYHIGLRVEAYSLGRVGIPVLLSPRSVFIIAMNVWDDAAETKLTEEPIRLTVFEGDAGVLVGTGLVRTREEQIAALAAQAAKEVETVLLDQKETWFAPKEGRERVEFERDPITGLAVEDAETEADPATPPSN